MANKVVAGVGGGIAGDGDPHVAGDVRWRGFAISVCGLKFVVSFGGTSIFHLCTPITFIFISIESLGFIILFTS